MMSIRTLLKGEDAAAEALRRAKFKFPGRQVTYSITGADHGTIAVGRLRD
jgi:ribosomal protein L16/L10AE